MEVSKGNYEEIMSCFHTEMLKHQILLAPLLQTHQNIVVFVFKKHQKSVMYTSLNAKTNILKHQICFGHSNTPFLDVD